uniref:Uncharacterized protein n=1 Tax=Magallana gigas TaxID=29159 RepID=A0A8W8MS70_MAGGI|nr:multiple epidermal growth factor-like domains protein 10 [Crassostrea gigas]
MFQLVVQMLTCMFMTRYTTASGCERFYKGCCHGFFWNSKTKQCERCMPGYTGVNCSSSCPYPYYGVDCQRTCKCSRDKCEVSTGCNSLTTVQIECISGYIGENCRGKCTYPYYGVDCQGQCDCDEDSCDFSTGCTNMTKGNA